MFELSESQHINKKQEDTILSNFFQDIIDGAGAGGMLGGPICTLFTGVALAIPGVNIVAAPVVLATTAITTASGAAAGTVIGGTVGAIHNATKDK